MDNKKEYMAAYNKTPKMKEYYHQGKCNKKISVYIK